MFKTLPGFREFYPEDVAKRSYIFSKWRSKAWTFGFQEFDPPVLESLELFTEKSGEEIKSQLFEFVDKGNRAVALRPEMTPSLARMVGEKASGIRRPVKWFAIGENYRYERQQKGRLRAFYQFNADILGEESLCADAEIMALLIETLSSFGLTEKEFCLRLGDRDLWLYFLRMNGLPESFDTKVLSVIDKIEKVSEEAFLEMSQKALQDSGVEVETFVAKIREFVKAQSLEVLEKYADNASEEFKNRLAVWRELFSMLESMGLSKYVRCDMGIVRGLAYYTGFVFEAFQIVGTGRALAGGGRYDALTKKLGYADMPAVGFGMGDVTLSDLLELTGKSGVQDNAIKVYAVIGSESLRAKALSIIFELRRNGVWIDYPLKSSNFGKQFKAANSLNAKYALIFGEEELQQNSVKVKNLVSGNEETISLEKINEYNFE